MTETLNAPEATQRRPVHAVVVDAGDLSAVGDGIADLYAGAADVIVVRRALDPDTLAEVGRQLDSDDRDPGWSRPNVKMPVEDLQVLGTDTPATPTYQAPRGTSLAAYLDSAAAHAGDAQAVFEPGFEPVHRITALLGRFAGGRPVRLARAADGRPYAPFTIRRLVDGKQIGVHHDYHYRLELYGELSQQVDTGTLLSYVATLRAPQAGGELFVYGATSDATDLPRLANGFAYDLPAIEARYDVVRLEMQAGDLFLLAAGRCLHRVGRIVGPQARITMGGFLALDRAREGVLFWS